MCIRDRDIEGAAGGPCVHDFIADARLDEGTQRSRRRERERLPGAYDDDLGSDFQQPRKACGLEGPDVFCFPRLHISSSYDDARDMARGVDLDEAFAIGGEEVLRDGLVEVKFHSCRSEKMVSSRVVSSPRNPPPRLPGTRDSLALSLVHIL